MVLHIIRGIFLLTILALTYSVATSEIGIKGLGSGSQLTFFMIIPLMVGMIVVAADLLWRRKNLRAIGGLFFGLLAGLAIAYVLGLVVELIADVFPGEHTSVAAMIKTLIVTISVFVCVTFVMQTKDDFRFIIPYVEFAKQAKGARTMLLDTSVIIDGRIADMAETRIIDSELIVPRFVLAELQAIADSADKLRRNRGRRGLDVLNRLQKSDKIDISILDTHVREVDSAGDVDNKLLALARHVGGRVVTNDYNLSKIAQLRGVEVININDLANALKTVVLPGESITVKIIKPGEEPSQGVGYMADGTMIVVDQGRDHIGEEIAILVTSTLQTSAGRMIFGRWEESSAAQR